MNPKLVLVSLVWARAPVLLFAARPAAAAGVVGNCTPQSCTEAALDAALAGGGLVSLLGEGPPRSAASPSTSLHSGQYDGLRSAELPALPALGCG